MCDVIERHFGDWVAQGVPRPIAQTDQEHVFVAWPHDQFRRYSGLERKTIPSDLCVMVKVYEFSYNLH